jgi:hypothetical protein
MAIQIDTEFIGRIENLIYYKWMNLYCIRTAPTKVHQTPASKHAAIIFGKVSSRSKLIRLHFSAFIASPRNKDMQQRLKAALRASIPVAPSGLDEIIDHPLKSFRFNEALLMEQCLGFQPQITRTAEGRFRFEIPPINPVRLIRAPAGSSSVQVELSIFSFSFSHDDSFGGKAAVLDIPYSGDTQPARSAELNISLEMPGIILVAAALTFWNGKAQLNKPGYDAAEIIGVFG